MNWTLYLIVGELFVLWKWRDAEGARVHHEMHVHTMRFGTEVQKRNKSFQAAMIATALTIAIWPTIPLNWTLQRMRLRK